LYIDVQNLQDNVPISEDEVAEWVKKFLTHKQISCDEVAIYFVDKKVICALHEEHFDDPTPTDCISFPLDKDHIGDVFVCPEVAREYVAANGGELEREVALYVIHGLLHLIGYDDIEESDAAEMRKQETAAMGAIFSSKNL